MTVSDGWRRTAWHFRRLCCSSLFFLAPVLALADDRLPDRVSFVGDIWCPYNCAEQDVRRGALVDILAEILAKRGIAMDYRVLPWSRALQEVNEGRLDGIIGAGERDAKFAMLTRTPWLHAELATLSHRDSGFRWQGLASLAGKSVVVIADYEYAAPLPAWLAANPDAVHQLSGDNAFRQAVLLIQHKRQQVFFSSYPALRRHLQAAKLDDTLVIHKTGFRTPIYMGVARSKPHSDALLALLNQGFDELKANGKTDAIILSYDL